MTNMITSVPYRTIFKEPSERPSRKIAYVLRELNKANCIEEHSYKKLRPSHEQPHRIHDSPWIHKTDTPLCPIISCMSSFAYGLSNYFADILSPIAGLSEQTFKNSVSCVDYLCHQFILDNEIMVTDVESLISSVPIEAACSIDQ